MIDYEQPQPPQTGAATQQTGLQQRCLQHLTLQHFCLQQRSLQQRCLQHFCLQQLLQLFSQPQEGAAAQVGSAAQVGAAAAQVGAGAAQVGAAAAQLGAAAQHEGLQQRLWWQRHFLYFTQQVGWQAGWQLLSQPQPPRNSNAEALDAIQNNATATHKPAIRLFMENSSNQKTQGDGNGNNGELRVAGTAGPAMLKAIAAGRDSDVQRLIGKFDLPLCRCYRPRCFPRLTNRQISLQFL